MNQTEVKIHLDNIIGEDSNNLSDVGFMMAVGKVWRIVRKVLIFIKPFLRLKKALKISVEAFIMLMDARFKVNEDD